VPQPWRRGTGLSYSRLRRERPATSDELSETMPGFISDTPRARDLIRIGDEAIARADDAALRAYFAEDYVFHGPGGDLGFDELSGYFASLRDAFSGLRLVREQIIADGNFLAARSIFSGGFHRRVHLLAHRPRRAHWPTPRMGGDRHVQARRGRAACRGVGGNRLPQPPDQARRHHDRIHPAGLTRLIAREPAARRYECARDRLCLHACGSVGAGTGAGQARNRLSGIESQQSPKPKSQVRALSPPVRC